MVLVSSFFHQRIYCQAPTKYLMQGQGFWLLQPTFQQGSLYKNKELSLGDQHETRQAYPKSDISWPHLDMRACRLSQWWLGKVLPWDKFQLISGFVAGSSGPLLFYDIFPVLCLQIFYRAFMPGMQEAYVALILPHRLCKSSRPSQVVLNVLSGL